MDLAGDFFRALLDQAPRSATARLPTSVQLNRMHTNIKCCNHVNGWKYGVASVRNGRKGAGGALGRRLSRATFPA